MDANSLMTSPSPKNNPPVKQSVMQSPHVFIPAACLPVKHSIIEHLEDLRAKIVPTQAGSRHVFMDDTGYFVTFPDDNPGRYHQALWLRTNKRTLLLEKYRLDSMLSYPASRPHATAQPVPFDRGRSNADSVVLPQHRSNAIRDSTGTHVDDVNFSIRGAAAAAASVESREPVTRRGAADGDFAIRGAAAISSPALSARSPPVETSRTVRSLQVGRTDLSVSPHIAGAESVSSKAPAAPGKLRLSSESILRQDRDDAASSISGTASSEVSGSKAPECHVCKSRNGHLVKCSTCNRRYHSHCHTLPPITQDLSGEWQCRRCQLKHVTLKRSAPQTPISGLDHSTQNKQRRLSISSAAETDGAPNIPSIVTEGASTAQSPPLAAASREDEIRDGSASPVLANTSILPPVLLDNDDEANNLVEESFTAASTGVVSKKGGKLKVVRRKISVPNLDISNEQGSEATPAVVQTSTMSLPAPPVDPQRETTEVRPVMQEADRVHTLEKQGAAAADMTNVHSLASAVIEDRPSQGKKAKKTQDFRKRKCTSCNLRSVPYNPYGRTVCQICKDAEAEVHQSSEPKVTDPKANGGPLQPRLESTGPRNPSVIVHAVEGQIEDTAPDKDTVSEAKEGNPVATATIEAAVSAIPVPEAVPTAAFDDSIVSNEFVRNEEATASLEVDVAVSQPPQETDPDESPLSDAISSDSTDEDDDVEPSTLISKRALNPKLAPELVSKSGPPSKKRKTRESHTTKPKDEFDLGDSFQRPPRSYRRLVHLAISETPGDSVRAKQVVQWIGNNVPTYSLGQGKWADGVAATLSFASDTSGKNGSPTLKRHDLGGGEVSYSILPEKRGEVDRWDAVLLRPISRSTKDRAESSGRDGAMSAAKRQTEESPSNSTSKPQSAGLLQSITPSKTKLGKRPARDVPLSELMDIDSDPDDGVASSPEEPSVQAKGSTAAGDNRIDSLFADDPMDLSADHIVGAGGPDVTDGFAVPDAANMVRTSRQAAGSNTTKPFSIHDVTLDQVLACRPAAVHTELYKAWPSLDPKKTEFDYEAKMAEIQARPGRKARFGQKKPVDAENVLAIVGGPSELPSRPLIDNSLGLTQEQFGDELSVQPCKIWEEFFGTTEMVRPEIVDGKLAYRPIGEKSRTVYKTSI